VNKIINSLFALCILIPLISCSQGFNHTWLLGTDTGFPMGKIEFDTNAFILIQQQRKMTFKDTQATICNSNGDFLISSNGVWIANSNNDTMMNGSNLNPGSFTSSWSEGLPIANGNLILPFPGDSTKFVLFHQTGDSLGNVPSTELFYSVIDMTHDNGLGGVDSSQKNIIIFHDTLSWGIGACKHANGRDWWIVAIKDSSDLIYKILLSSNGIASVTTQNLSITPYPYGNVTQPTFSPDGNKFAFSYANGGTIVDHYLYLFDFDRCTGQFYNPNVIDLADGYVGAGVAFSANSQFAYATSVAHTFQINTNILSVDTVATYDGFCFPNAPWCTSFDLMYLAANSKIYIGSGNAVQFIHEMNDPDSGGLSCDLQQHAINLNGIWNFRSVPNHPNYYLGPVIGSICDSLGLSVQEINHDFHFNLFPNPTNGNFTISYFLPQNKEGKLEIFDIDDRKVYSLRLPQWSILQMINLPELSDGLYQCVITSGSNRGSKKVFILH
jgi:hypothetical protein